MHFEGKVYFFPKGNVKAFLKGKTKLFLGLFDEGRSGCQRCQERLKIPKIRRARAEKNRTIAIGIECSMRTSGRLSSMNIALPIRK
jgi:hypothetical protein